MVYIYIVYLVCKIICTGQRSLKARVWGKPETERKVLKSKISKSGYMLLDKEEKNQGSSYLDSNYTIAAREHTLLVVAAANHKKPKPSYSSHKTESSWYRLSFP